MTPTFEFCVPPNPVLKGLRLHAELNLHKLRTCRNIAGMKRQLDPYAAPTDTTSGMPSIGAGGQLVLPGTAPLHPTAYRYPVLVERAKQLVQLAGQVEAVMLSALQNRDAQDLMLLQAPQQLGLAQAGVRLQDLRVTEARSGVTLAALQQSRAQLQVAHFTDLLERSISDLEQQALEMLGLAVDYQLEAAGYNYAAFEVLTAIAVTEAAAAAAAASSVVGAAEAPKLLGSAAGHAAGAMSSLSSRFSSLAGVASTRASILAARAS